MVVGRHTGVVWAAVLCLGLAIACHPQEGKTYRVDERFTLAADDRAPFGGYLFYRFAEKAFTEEIPDVNKRPFVRWYQQESRGEDNNQVYILASPALVAFTEEAEAMEQFVRRGNTLLIVTNFLSDAFQSVLSVKLDEEINLTESAGSNGLRDTYRSFTDSLRPDTTPYGYYYSPFVKSVSASARYSSVQVLGTNEMGKPDFIRIRMGQGQLIVATNARAFGNYFLLHRQNARFALRVLSYLPAYPSLVAWDDFYRRNLNRPPEDRSMFSALLAIPPLRWAFWLTVILAALWVLTNLRRRQRMIPVIAPNVNSSVAFAQTIARLYFQKKDNASVARKMTTYFFEHLRQRYYLQPVINSEQLPVLLHTKTGMPAPDAEILVELMQKAQHNAHFSDEELLRMHALIYAVLHQPASVGPV